MRPPAFWQEATAGTSGLVGSHRRLERVDNNESTACVIVLLRNSMHKDLRNFDYVLHQHSRIEREGPGPSVAVEPGSSLTLLKESATRMATPYSVRRRLRYHD